MKKPNDKQIEKAIEKAYYRLAQGRQIDIMKIGSLFGAALMDIKGGADIDKAVTEAIEKYCI